MAQIRPDQGWDGGGSFAFAFGSAAVMGGDGVSVSTREGAMVARNSCALTGWLDALPYNSGSVLLNSNIAFSDIHGG